MPARPPQYIVHPERRFIYCFIPKVACSSVKTALAPLFDIQLPPGHGEVHRAFRHSGYQVNRGAFIKNLRAGAYRDFSAGAFVRNPYDRLLSCYLQKLGPDADNDSGLASYSGLYMGMGFSDFVAVVSKIPDAEADPHFRSQHVSLTRPNGNFIPSYIGNFETLTEDFPIFASKIGAPEIELPHVNPSQKLTASYRDYYDAHTRELAAHRYETDLWMFGYTF